VRYLGDFADDATVDFLFSTQTADGVPITLAGTPSLAVYKAGNATPRTADITLDIAWNAVVGMHHVSIVTTNAFYALATDYTCIIAAGTVDGVSVVGRVLAHFSLENRKATIDAKEALTRLPDASPGGIDGLPVLDHATGLILTGAGAAAVSAVASAVPNTVALEATLTALKGGTWGAGDTLEAIHDYASTAASEAASAHTDASTAAGSAGTAATAAGEANAHAHSIESKVDTMDANVDSVLADTGELQTEWADGGRLDLILDAASAPTVDQVSHAVWDDLLAGHTDAGSAGEAMTAAGAGTPVPLPGAVTWVYTVTLDGAACQGAAVRFYSDAGYTTFVQGGISNESGIVTLHLLAGTYYIVVDAPGQERAYDSEVVA
jgi:hypothetical protein